MDEPISISKDRPSQKSQDYDLLREEGIAYIQSIAGKLWTDYNTHDPGVTILEVLCYAITDLGYRASFDIKDIIAPPPELTEKNGSSDVFTAAEILPNAPVTIADYRKLMMDVVVESGDPGCSSVGVKNAWIEKAAGPEIELFVDSSNSRLTYTPVKPGDQPLDPRILHSVLLEFEACDTFGDLNENTLVRDFLITDHTPEPELNDVTIRVTVEFPRWDDTSIDWSSDASVTAAIADIALTFQNLPGQFTISFELTELNSVLLEGTQTSPSGPIAIDGLDQITQALNAFIFDPEEGMIRFYRDKIAKIRAITDRVKSRLHANRNLCEDFMEFNALRIEEILLCSDIELKADTDVDRAQATIYHEISKFLSPDVPFYTLDEMTTKCYDDSRYELVAISKSDRRLTIQGIPDPLPEPGSIITLTGTDRQHESYHIKETKIASEDYQQTDFFVVESPDSELISGDESLVIGDPEHNPCMPFEKIFEGPLLNHGFIDDDELEMASRRKVIRVSDLIQIIMDVDGVTAVKNIQIANDPQDNEDGAIPTKNVRWCLKLAFDKNYVPRLNTDRSRLTFYKDQLPYKASRTAVDQILDELSATERPRRPHRKGPFDLSFPEGEFRDTGRYTSIQNDFPLVYGIGEEGVPGREEQGRRADLPTPLDAKQLKGYLMHFDQLLANYLAQLAHVRDLFSMNPQRDSFGNFEIGRTYFTQPLYHIVPHAEELYVDLPGHAADLNHIAESQEVFYDRRNRFLDHLIARFAEQFTDYALLVSHLDGPKAPDELIEDKLAFLNAYPDISSRRGTAITYGPNCRFWHRENASGLEKRAAMLAGIDQRPASDLHFGPGLKIIGSNAPFDFSVDNDLNETLLVSAEAFETKDSAREALELTIIAGAHKQNYQIIEEDGGIFSIGLWCDGTMIAKSAKSDFTSDAEGADADQVIDEIVTILKHEFFENPQSNRKNLASPIYNYFEVEISLSLKSDPPGFTITYQLHSTPFEFSPSTLLLSGEQSINGPDRESADIISVDTSDSTISVEGQITEDLVAGDTIYIRDSAYNDGLYTISSYLSNGTSTEITVDEMIPSDSVPLGRVLYNIITEKELQALAETSIDDILWAVVSYGSKRSGYSFDPSSAPFSSPYRFRIQDLRGSILGVSEAADFNGSMADEFNSLSNKTITLVADESSSEMDSDHTFSTATARGPFIDIETENPTGVSATSVHVLSISDSFPLSSINKSKRKFSVTEDLSERLEIGDSISISGHSSSSGIYTILEISFDGSETIVTVKEPIPSEESEEALFSYTKSFEVTSISGPTITIKGGADEEAVDEMIRFINNTFYSTEGLHLVEHILLRPKTDGPLFVDADAFTLHAGLADEGELTFFQNIDLVEAVTASKTLRVDGDLTPLLSAGTKLQIHDQSTMKQSVTVASASYTDPQTNISVNELLIKDIPAESTGASVAIETTVSILSVNPDDLKITIPGALDGTLKKGSVMTINGSTDTINDGRYIVADVNESGGDTVITIGASEEHVQDSLLSINLDENCDCTLDDPYTCMAHVVLPYWPGRFKNTEFRKFFEKTLRREAPAHVFLNICWVSYRHMSEFERAWKTWLLEQAKYKPDNYSATTALSQLINAIEQLRNVYPQGTLHDCDEDENLENSIILNHSALGEI